MTPKRPDHSHIMAALRASAAQNGGVPRWATVAKLHEVDRKTLKAWWAELIGPGAPQHDPAPAFQPRRPQLTVHLGADAPVDAAEISGPPETEIEFWEHRWRQLAMVIRDCKSFGAMPALLKQQDDIWFKLRAARDAEGSADITPEQGAERIMQLVGAMPDGLLMQVAATIRQRGIIQ